MLSFSFLTSSCSSWSSALQWLYTYLPAEESQKALTLVALEQVLLLVVLLMVSMVALGLPLSLRALYITDLDWSGKMTEDERRAEKDFEKLWPEVSFVAFLFLSFLCPFPRRSVAGSPACFLSASLLRFFLTRVPVCDRVDQQVRAFSPCPAPFMPISKA